MGNGAGLCAGGAVHTGGIVRACTRRAAPPPASRGWRLTTRRRGAKARSSAPAAPPRAADRCSRG
eukprot:1940787-Prymnesium_polylepis.1